MREHHEEPVVLVVGGGSLDRIHDELAARCARGYDIQCTASLEEGLDRLQELTITDHEVALPPLVVGAPRIEEHRVIWRRPAPRGS